MKKAKSTRKTSSTYVKDENPELWKVVRGLKNLVKNTVPATRETVTRHERKEQNRSGLSRLGSACR